VQSPGMSFAGVVIIMILLPRTQFPVFAVSDHINFKDLTFVLTLAIQKNCELCLHADTRNGLGRIWVFLPIVNQPILQHHFSLSNIFREHQNGPRSYPFNILNSYLTVFRSVLFKPANSVPEPLNL
jgi:hypothetical protein